jgi:hypothetical protein
MYLEEAPESEESLGSLIIAIIICFISANSDSIRVVSLVLFTVTVGRLAGNGQGDDLTATFSANTRKAIKDGLRDAVVLCALIDRFHQLISLSSSGKSGSKLNPLSSARLATL